MGAKGSGKTAGSGRKKGTPNKTKLPLLEKAEELGVDPFQILLMFAKGDWQGLGFESQTRLIQTRNGVIAIDVIEPDHRLKAAAEACQYLYPKRKAIEVSIDPEDEERPLQGLTDEELDAL